MNKNEIIYIPSIVLYVQIFLYKGIELMHVDIGKDLTRKVSNRKSFSLFCIEEAFTFWKTYPVSTISIDNDILFDVRKENNSYKIEYHFLFFFWYISFYYGFNFHREKFFIYTHKESLYIKFQNISILCVILCC